MRDFDGTRAVERCVQRRATMQRHVVFASLALMLNACGAEVPLDDSVTEAVMEPSGESPPPSDATWTRTFVDDFSGTAVDTTRWTVYNGVPHSGLGGWDATHATAGAGLLTLDTYRDANGRWLSAGVSNRKSFTQTYGRFLVRMRFSAGHGVKGVALLWPSNGTWPPEVDFMETSPADTLRTTNKMTNHYSSSNLMQHASFAVDLQQWHTIGVDWSATALQYTVDGVVTATMTGHIPSIGMHMAMQSEIGACSLACPDNTTPAHVPLQFDWVAAYTHN
jgi:beta-glucanase (GH16 family)